MANNSGVAFSLLFYGEHSCEIILKIDKWFRRWMETHSNQQTKLSAQVNLKGTAWLEQDHPSNWWSDQSPLRKA